MLENLPILADVVGDDITGEGEHGGVADNALLEDSDISSATTDVNQCHTRTLVAVIEDGAVVDHAILGPRTKVAAGARIKGTPDSIAVTGENEVVKSA